MVKHKYVFAAIAAFSVAAAAVDDGRLSLDDEVVQGTPPFNPKN